MKKMHCLAAGLLVVMTCSLTALASDNSLEVSLLRKKSDVKTPNLEQIVGDSEGKIYIMMTPTEELTDLAIGLAAPKGKDTNEPQDLESLRAFESIDTDTTIVVKMSETMNSDSPMLYMTWTDAEGEDHAGYLGYNEKAGLINGSGKSYNGENTDSADTEKKEKSDEVSDGTDVYAFVSNASETNVSALTKGHLSEARATSTINQSAKYHNGANTSASMIMDDNDNSSWQEGVSGSGIGEGVQIKLTQKMKIEAFTFKLGNWKSSKYYYGNNRPKSLAIRVGKSTSTVTFPDSWETFYVKLSEPVLSDTVEIRIEDVYRGSSWDDTCIAEVGVYGKD